MYDIVKGLSLFHPAVTFFGSGFVKRLIRVIWEKKMHPKAIKKGIFLVLCQPVNISAIWCVLKSLIVKVFVLNFQTLFGSR